MVIGGGLRIAFQSESVYDGNALLKTTCFSLWFCFVVSWCVSVVDLNFFWEIELMSGVCLYTSGGLVDTRTIILAFTTTRAHTQHAQWMTLWFMTGFPISVCCPVDISDTTILYPFSKHTSFLMNNWNYWVFSLSSLKVSMSLSLIYWMPCCSVNKSISFQRQQDEIMVEMVDCLCWAKREIHIEYIELAALPPIIQIANKMMKHITFEYMTAMSIINNDERELMWCTLLEVGWWWAGSGMLSMLTLLYHFINLTFRTLMSSDLFCIFFSYSLFTYLNSSPSVSTPLTSGVWRYHQGWA